MSSFLLEVFTNQCLSCTDLLATWVNHFLNLSLRGGKLSIHNKAFIKTFKGKLSDNSNDSQIDAFHEWTKNKLYPYRNIIHHMGEISSWISLQQSFTAVPKESGWDFVQMREDLKGYPSHTAFLIATNTINPPNIITGDAGDSHKYEPICDFAENWKNQVYEMIKFFVEIVVAELNINNHHGG